MPISTTRFGTIEVDNDRIVHFPLGLLGFETLQRFVLIDSDEVAPMRWLQSVDDGSLAFLVVEPHLFFEDYKVKLTGEDKKVLDLTRDEDLALACLVVIPDNPADMTINLLGPLVMNAEKRVGKQLVMHDSGYSPRQRLLPDEAAQEEPALV